MKKLSELQNEFLKSILSLKEPSGLTSDSRFRVYSRAYRIRLTESLAEDFLETLSFINNAEKFIEDYIEKYPSTFWTLGEFGLNFPSYVESKHHHLAIYAKKEWARWVATSVGEPDILSLVPTGNEITIVINPSLQIISSESIDLIYYFKGEVKEFVINSGEELVLRKCLIGDGISKLGISQKALLLLVNRWTTAGIIVGFKEIK